MTASGRLSHTQHKVVREACAAYAAGDDAAETFVRLGQRYGMPPLEVGRLVVSAMKKAGVPPGQNNDPQQQRKVL